jgi:tripartite-type tricarboxylate transporter receptor subunit TctC
LFLLRRAAGGGADAVARALAQKLSERLGQQFIVDNRPGGAGNIGTQGVIMGASLITSIPTIALYFATQKHFIRGIALSGLK